jgi:hypothetical protein
VFPGPALVSSDAAPGDEEVGLGVGVELAEADGLVVGVALPVVLGFGFGDGVLDGQPVELGDGEILALLAPPVALAVELAEVVAVLLGFPLAPVLPVELGLALAVPVGGGAAELAGVTLGWVDGFDEPDEVVFAELDPVPRLDAHDEAPGAVLPSFVLPGAAPPTAEDAPKEPCPSVLPPPPLLPGLLGPVIIPKVWPSVTIPSRNGGTTARAMPTANTATPTAMAGRSIASRQSLGCCGARCA